MNQRFWIMGSVTAVAGLALVTMFWFGRSESRRGRQPIEPIDATAPKFDPSQVGDSLRPIEQTEGIHVQFRNRNGQLITFVGERSNPVGEGVVQVERPRLQIQKAGRVIQIWADSGQIVVTENNDLREGDLVGHVVVSVFHVPSGHVGDISESSPHLQLRIHVDVAHVDNEMGEVHSDSEVLVTGRDIAFAGRGLFLNYNELHARIDRLLIKQGKYLHFTPAGSGVSSGSHAVAENDRVQAVDDADRSEAAGEVYTARFEQGVAVASRPANFNCDRLEVVFSLNSGQAFSAKARTEPIDRGAANSNVENSQSSPPVRITWSGPLTIVPRAERPADWSGPDDKLVVMSGRIVRVESSTLEKITAQRVSYLASAQRVDVEGTKQMPVRIDSPNLGNLVVPRLTIDQQAQVGQLSGPGRLETPLYGANTSGVHSASAEVVARMPSDMRIGWSEKVDMTFFDTDESGSPVGANRQMRPLRTVEFHGDVTVKQPAFDLAAQRLGIGLSPPIDGQQLLQTLAARGQVVVDTHGNAFEKPISIRAEQVAVDLESLEGQAYPSRLQAEGKVSLHQVDQTLEAGLVDVRLTRFVKAKPPMLSVVSRPPSEAAAQAKVEIRQITAKRGVRIRFEEDEQTFVVHADKIIADETTDQIELFGTEAAPAHIERGDVTLAGRYVQLRTKRKTIHVRGPGTWAFRQIRAESDSSSKSAVMSVSWSDSMTYDHVKGQAEFAGQVETEGVSGNDATRLTAGQLSVHLGIRGGESSLRRPIDRTIDPAQAGTMVRGVRYVQRVVAEKNVTFLAIQWLDEPKGQVATRLLAKGHQMIFENTARLGRKVEQIRFVGDGSMQFEDYRAKRPEAAGSKDQVKLSGNGVTAFTWKGYLLLDALHNDMRIYDEVWMIHRPLGDVEPVQLLCDRFIADLEATGGLEGWTAGVAPKPAIHTLIADQGVVVTRADDEIRTGQLKYTDRDRYITLTADNGMATVLTIGEQPSSYVEPVRWNVQTGELELPRAGPLRIPVRSPK